MAETWVAQEPRLTGNTDTTKRWAVELRNERGQTVCVIYASTALIAMNRALRVETTNAKSS